MNTQNWWLLPVALLSFVSILGLKSTDADKHASLSEKVIIANTLNTEGFFESAPCWFEQEKPSNKHPTHEIECGWYHTASTAESSESSFRLPVVIFHYKRGERRPDPLVYLAGGPGSGAWLDEQNITFWMKWYEKNLNIKRDLILFDQRGSGMSKPSIRCDEFQNATKQILLSPLTPEQNAETYRQASVQCRDRLVQQGLPFNQLGTPQSAQDLAGLLTTLGYKTWNLYGVSYGTRLAIEVQARYPQHVRSLILDSVYSPDVQLFSEWPKLYKASIDRIFNYCKTSRDCGISSDQLKVQFWQVLERLKHAPVTVKLDPQKTTDLQYVTINDETLLSILFDLEYMSGILSDLPMLISSIYEDDHELLKHYVNQYVSNQFEPSFNDVSFWSVECHDNPKQPVFNLNESEDYTNIKYYLPPSYNLCDVWRNDSNAQPLLSFRSKDSENKKAEHGELPVLIFSGEDDPITPTDWAINTASYYNNQAYLFSFSGISHSVMDNKPCTTELFFEFLSRPELRPSADCRLGVEDMPRLTDSDDPSQHGQENHNRKRLPIKMEAHKIH